MNPLFCCAVLQSVKDVLQSLVDDNLVETDKIGAGNYVRQTHTHTYHSFIFFTRAHCCFFFPFFLAVLVIAKQGGASGEGGAFSSFGRN